MSLLVHDAYEVREDDGDARFVLLKDNPKLHPFSRPQVHCGAVIAVSDGDGGSDLVAGEWLSVVD